MIILFTHRSLRNSRYEKIELITAISSLIVMNSFCCEERLLCVCVCVCVCFVTWLIQEQQSVQSSVTSRALLLGWCTYTNSACTQTHTHTPGTLLYSWVCHVVFGSEALCRCRGSLCQVPPHYVQQPTHTPSSAKIQSKHTLTFGYVL